MVVSMPRKKKKVIGLVERIRISGSKGKREILAKVDTGASRTTISTSIAAEVGVGPITDLVKIKASQAKETRPLAEATLELAGESFKLSVGVAGREEMRYSAIIGRDILQSGKFLIDPEKEESSKEK